MFWPFGSCSDAALGWTRDRVSQGESGPFSFGGGTSLCICHMACVCWGFPAWPGGPFLAPGGLGPGWDAFLVPRCSQRTSGSGQGSPRGGTSSCLCQHSARRPDDAVQGCRPLSRCPGVLVPPCERVRQVKSLGWSRSADTCAFYSDRAPRPPRRWPSLPGTPAPRPR